jgi:hypothetical protein
VVKFIRKTDQNNQYLAIAAKQCVNDFEAALSSIVMKTSIFKGL